MQPNPTSPALAGSGELTEPFAPRTYASAWQFHDEIDACDPPPVLLTAEDWLGEEADVYAGLSPDEEVESDPRTQIMRAIAAEIRALRVERQQFADALTAARTEVEGLRAVYRAATDFCAELQEDAEGVPQDEMRRLHAALDAADAARSSGAQTEESRLPHSEDSTDGR